jgi:hypothetical protein
MRVLSKARHFGVSYDATDAGADDAPGAPVDSRCRLRDVDERVSILYFNYVTFLVPFLAVQVELEVPISYYGALF